MTATNFPIPWEPKVQKRIEDKGYHELFKLETPYLESPCDKLIVNTDHPLTDEFRALAKEAATYMYHGSKSKNGYQISWGFGPVYVFESRLHWSMRKYSVRINPSTGCMTKNKIVQWIKFIFGRLDGIYVRSIDWKVDVNDALTTVINRSCWATGFRTVKYLSNSTRVWGSLKSMRTLMIYDKQKQLKECKNIHLVNSMTRIEMRFRYGRDKEIPFLQFIQMDFKRLLPFEGVMLIDPPSLMQELGGKKGVALAPDDVYKTMKSLRNAKRKDVIRRLSSAGHVVYITPIFEKQLARWVV